MDKFADLHTHTIFSDGTYTPLELIKKAAEKKLDVLAVTDHDSVEGIDPAVQEAGFRQIEVVPGIELSCEHETVEIHMLGYFIDHQNSQLKKTLDFLKNNRIERIHKIVDRLNGMGIAIDPEDVFSFSKGGSVGRMHVARALVCRKAVCSTGEAFQKLIGDGCPGYYAGFKLSVPEAIKIIKESGGVPVLAHPYLVKKDSLLAEFVKYGLKGLEVFYPEHSQSMVNFYLGFCRENNLLVTGGSDCHGDAKKEAPLGCVKVPYELVEKLRQEAKFSS
jgi:hypothetical protein